MNTQRLAHPLGLRQSSAAILVAIACYAYGDHAQAQTYAPWLRQIGIPTPSSLQPTGEKGRYLVLSIRALMPLTHNLQADRCRRC